MSLVRSFTSRLNKATDTSGHRGKHMIRPQISSPLALISTSNVMLNNAQHIAGTTEIQFQPQSPDSPKSSNSVEDSDGASHTLASASTDASSIDETPSENHLSCYFKPTFDSSITGTIRQVSNSSTLSDIGIPSLPQRKPSHSKRAHESVHRQRSISRVLSPPPSVLRDTFTPAGGESFAPNNHRVETPRDNPFGQELAQLDEVAEEFGHAVRDAEASQDNLVMNTHGLAHYSAGEYISEIEHLLSDVFYDELAAGAQWV